VACTSVASKRADLRQAAEESFGRAQGLSSDVVKVVTTANGLVAKCTFHLFQQPGVQRRQVVAHVIDEGFQLETLAPEVSRKQNLAQELENGDHRVAAGQARPC
jgi:hypothetical protein